MHSKNKKFSLLVVIFSFTFASAQYEIKATEGYSPNIGLMVDMLEDLKERVEFEVKDLELSQIDYQYDQDANSIGSLVMHLVSTEAYYQVETLEGRQWTEDEKARIGLAGALSDESKKVLKGKPIKFYLDLWDEVRQKTLSGLKTKDDEWFASNIEEGINYHWVWYHVMEHSASHLGQINTVKNRLPQQ